MDWFIMLKTKDLTGTLIKLRIHRASDADSIYKNIRDKEIRKYTLNIPFPYTKAHAVDFIKQATTNRKLKSAYEFAITSTNDNEVIGGISLMNLDWKNKNAELGYWLGKKYRNKGYISEAIKLILGFAFNELKLNRISARLWEKNLASIKVLKKNKFKKEGLLREMVFKAGKWQNDLVYAVIRKDWVASKLRA